MKLKFQIIVPHRKNDLKNSVQLLERDPPTSILDFYVLARRRSKEKTP
jgi:hypothetical protein